ncbi:hypothetical protein E2542_SST30535 [Spatholobus suberectus]|nr:hypothetical protein E2542_SST30535 [Spatholobus suberectus]
MRGCGDVHNGCGECTHGTGCDHVRAGHVVPRSVPRLPSERWTTVGGVLQRSEEPELSREDHRRPPGCVQLPEASCGCHFWLQCQQRGCTSWQMWRQHPLQDQHLHQLRQDEVMNRGSCKEEMEGKIFNLVIL